MRVIVATEHRFQRSPLGTIYSVTGRGYSFWRRYLHAFDEVLVVGRVADTDLAAEHWEQVEGNGVRVEPLTNYQGLLAYVQNYPRIQRAVNKLWRDNPTSAIILRLPGQVGNLMWRSPARDLRPVGVEVVGDPFDVFTLAAVKHPLTPFFRWLFTARLRQQCQQASAVAYVTKDYLQRRYPPAPDALSTHYSSIELSKQAFAANPRRFPESRDAYTLVFVGTLAQLYKAPDVLIHAVARCVQKGLDLKLTILGDGRHRAELEALVARLQLGERVSFIGEVPAGAPVRAQLDKADLFVLPSRTEGLPRAVIEAMARGLPCIGSTAGGIPELLPPEAMVPPGDAEMLARKIIEVIRSPERMNEMSERNLHKAREYQDEVLAERRNDFYQYIKNETEAWLNKHPR